MNGMVWCVPFCPQLGTVPNCARPRLTTSSEGCCEEWVCDDDNSIPDEQAGLAAHSDPPDLPHFLPNHISTLLLPPPPRNHHQAGAQISFKGTVHL